MSIDDRDWYRDLLRERQGLKPKYQLWRGHLPASDDVQKPKFVQSSGSWHPVLQILLFLVICIGVFLFLRLFK